ncbi:MAG: hypothetical protein LBR48_07380, partial [Dysgonamonadaceae bacterium]|nr:hypothetical protein [Dysgonamonadaceae bacterium]
MKEIKTYIFSNTTKYRRLLACYLVGFMACCFASCSDEDGGGALSDSGTLTFTLGGIAEDSEETLTRAQLEPETIRQDLGDGLSLVYTLSLDPQTATRADAYPVKDKTKYRIIVYKDNGDFVTEQQFTAGETARIENLEKVKYKLAAYSYNTEDDLDEVGSSATTLTVDPKNDLLHWTGSVDLTSGKADPVNITFKHRFTHLTVKISSYLMGKSSPIINVPSSATLTPGYKGEQTLLTDTKLTQLSDFAEPQTFAFGTAPNDTVAASTTTRYVFTGNKPVTMDFSGDLIIDAPSGTKTVQNPTVTFNKKPDGLLPGHFYTLAMRIEASKGNYYPYDLAIGKDYEATIPLGDNRTYSYTRADGTPVNGKTELTFLRYNLGADPSMSPKEQMAYPFTDVKNIRVYGGLFQWGRKDVEHSLRDPYSASDTEHFQNAQYPSYDPINDHKFAWGTTSWWCASDNKESNMWGNGGGYTKQTDFSYNSAKPNTTANDWNPCPTGYR